MDLGCRVCARVELLSSWDWAFFISEEKNKAQVCITWLGSPTLFLA